MGNNSIYVDNMTRLFGSYANQFSAGANRASASAFGETLAQKKAQARQEPFPAQEAGQAAVSKENMSLEEYRQYIQDRISRIPMHPSQSGWHWQISITDEGLAAMKSAPAYEAHVLQTIRSNFSYHDKYYSQNYTVLQFGATEEEFHGESVSGGGPFSEKEESFWDRRAKRREKLQEQIEELADKKALALRQAKNETYARRLEGKTGSDAVVLPQFTTSAVDILEALEEA